MNVQPKPPAAATPLMSERRVGLIGALLAVVGPFSMAVFTPAMPDIARAFATTESAVKLTLSLYFGGFALSQLVCGPLSDGLGRKPIITAFMAIYIAASLLALFAPTIEVLIAARFLQGIGAGVGIAMSRAIVRDLFTNETSARIMNMIAMILGVGPALAPTLGGLTLEFFDWHAVFLMMLALGVTIATVTRFALAETVARDIARIRPRALMASYASLLRNQYFLSSSLVQAGTMGAIYSLASMLPFILMDRVGLTPTQFGIGMLMQSGMFLLGSFVVYLAMPRMGSLRLVTVGIAFAALGAVAIAAIPFAGEPSFLLVMGPVAVYAFGMGFILPGMSTASLAPFPHIAGAAAAMNGFLQMGAGFVSSSAAALFGDPVTAMGTIIPVMGLVASLSWLWWRTLPMPALGSFVASRQNTPPPPSSG